MVSNQITIKKEETGVELSKIDVITLNAEKRKLLIKMVPKVIDMSKETEAFEEAKNAVIPKLNAFIRNALPIEDMAVLEKYNSLYTGSTSFRATHKNTGNYRGYDTCMFWFEVAPFSRPKAWDNTSDYSALAWRDVGAELFEECQNVETLSKQLSIIKDKKIASYISLINGSKTLNQVAAVWEEVADYLKGSLPAKVAIIKQITEDEINTVKEDVSRRAK